MRLLTQTAAITLLSVTCPTCQSAYAADGQRAKVEKAVAQVVQRLRKQYGIPGMAVGVVTDGKSYVFDFGIASKTTRKPVTNDTLFEIGSISKTFTATLASYAQLSDKLKLTDAASKYLPSLVGTNFDKVSLLNLGTHTSGGLPLQVPAYVTNGAQLMAYFQKWKPAYASGTYRTYSNPSIGLLGMIAAKSMNNEFAALMENKLFLDLGLKHTYLNVPQSQMKRYAQGYTTKDKPVRMTPGVLANEAYGIKTTVADLLHFIEANMGMLKIDKKLQQAIMDAHTGYFRVGLMTQDLIWEQYPYPVSRKDLLAGNSAKISLEPNPVTILDPPQPPKDNVLINETGSTNGFAAYVAFIPKKKLAIVLLANKSYPIDARVAAAYEILTQLAVNSL